MKVAREQGDLADVGCAGQSGDPAFEADGEPTVGRHAVPERLEVSLERGEVVACEGVRVVVASVEPLPTGDQFEPAEDQVEARTGMASGTSGSESPSSSSSGPASSLIACVIRASTVRSSAMTSA